MAATLQQGGGWRVGAVTDHSPRRPVAAVAPGARDGSSPEGRATYESRIPGNRSTTCEYKSIVFCMASFIASTNSFSFFCERMSNLSYNAFSTGSKLNCGCAKNLFRN